MNKTLKSYLRITASCIPYTIAFNCFYAPNNLTCGGITGIAQIIHAYAPFLGVGLLTFAMNLPLFIIGVKKFGGRILFGSLYAVGLTSLLIDVLEAVHPFPPIDPMLASVYGGVLIGLGLGLMLLDDATTGGTELGAKILKLKIPQLSIGKICLVIDLTVVILYSLVFGNILNALYGAIALYLATMMIDIVVYGGNKAKIAHIVSDRHEEIAKALLEKNLGLTKLHAAGAYTEKERPVLLCVVHRREIVGVKKLVAEIDPTAFFVISDAHEVLGEGFGEYKDDGM